MKNLILILIVCFLTNSAWTQNKYNDFKYCIKIYNLSSFDVVFSKVTFPSSYNFHSYTEITNSTTNYLNPTIAFQWKSKRDNFKEIELKAFSFRNFNNYIKEINDTSGVIEHIQEIDKRTAYISLRYEYIYAFNKSKDRRFNFSLGFAFSPFYKLDKSIPRMENWYGTSTYNIGIETYLIPRLTFNLSKRIFIDLNLPFCLSDLGMQSNLNNNPQIPVKQRRVILFNFSELPKIYSCRLGLGIKL